MSRLREHKRRARGDIHREMSVSALLILASSPTPVPCNVRVWWKIEGQMNGDLQSFNGAERAEPEDRVRFDLTEFAASQMPRRGSIVSVEPGEAYRIDHMYPADLGYQTARVTRLAAPDAAGLPVPE